MNRIRLEAFSDGVLAIIITIMVLEIKVPHGNDFNALKPLIPVVVSYVLSFIYLGIYWNNHHHMMHTVKRVSGAILWANLHLLFWLSLVPFVTGWIGENHFDPIPMALYGIVLLMAAIAYFILQNQIIKSQGKNSLLERAIGNDLKGKISPIIYSVAILSNFLSQWISGSLYILVALIWLIPDKRIEITLKLEDESKVARKIKNK
ncbi:MAG TPA: TMEM175 family protein [Prolixibacteraceae bacterium]|nr:TMEM175 family protein [Prolixibacteraceae bacterium]